MSTLALALAFERPAALVLLGVPLVLYFLARRRRASEVLAVGDLEPWRAARADDGAPRAVRPPRPVAAFLLALAALAAGALALAGPRVASWRPRWTAVLDASASMDLAAGATTRRELALAAARDLAAREGADLEWARVHDGSTDWGAWDAPDCLWVTDAAPRAEPRYAGYVASGGVAVPGPVAIEGRDRIDWDGARLVVVAGAAPERCVHVTGLDAASPRSPLERVLAAWTDARGLRYAARADEPCVVLSVVGPRPPAGETVRAGREGWSASGARHASLVEAGAESNLPAEFEPWIALAGDWLVAAAPGRVDIAWNPGEPDDPAAFAVSWARLFDARVLAPAGIVPLEERRAAGAPASRAPAVDASRAPARFDGFPAALAALLAFAALAARR